MSRTLPTAVIADMDGTLVDVSSIRHHAEAKDFDAFHAASADCPPNQMAIDWVKRHHARGDVILVLTGREDKWHQLSHHWLVQNMPVLFCGPFMRKAKDYRPDHEVKREMYDWLSKRYRITAAIDDRPSIISLWTELGLDVTVVPGWPQGVA
ncbi:hypothetical protein SEA_PHRAPPUCCINO_5 [Mycobacterium phage Phrappuccino]|uniref:Polynucleotide kinase PNKP phosphatase domain-containing protein n=1 Tax=Mycobacterium phage Phrappuccino TaxID=2591223 RepID=A0A514DDJ0_9CAUD|nr:hypothetical protein KHQ87_gp005 [Mycobacterium phage Phrappuccino]QDH91683.1 hypothetical protein SEA_PHRAPPUCCINO_5 [Mycobacterium phage Phrappuccino]QIQ63127.1 hypothetical protein SEA_SETTECANDELA_5 [Mycobacterium phage Settecandela]